MIGVGDADVRGGVRRNVRNDIIVNFAVIGIQTQVHSDVRVDIFKILDGFLIDVGLAFVRVILCPERDLIIPRGVKSNLSLIIFEISSSGIIFVSNVSTHIDTGFATPIAYDI